MTEIELNYEVGQLTEMCKQLEPILRNEKVLDITMEFAINDFELRVSTNNSLKKFLILDYAIDDGENWGNILIDYNHPVPYADRIRKFILCEDKENTYKGII